MICASCGKPIEKPEGHGGTGYGNHGDEGVPVCYPCCANLERLHMRENGRTVLYLLEDKREVTDWPGHLRYRIDRMSRGRHNIAGSRVDVWFRDETGARWHGVQYGQWTQLCHCRRLKAA